MAKEVDTTEAEADTTLLGGDDKAADDKAADDKAADDKAADDKAADDQTADDKAADDKAADEDDKGEDDKTGAPEKYEDFVLPEGVTIQDQHLETFTALAKETNLPQAEAQKFIDLATKFADDGNKQNIDAWNATRAGWVKELKEDSEFGGVKLTETLERANRVLRKHGSSTLVEELKTTGFGDNSGLVKLLAKMDLLLGEDQTDGDKANTDTPKKDAAEVLYGKK